MALQPNNFKTGEDSEWEYEYFSDEYEKFYVTVNLPPERSKKSLVKKGNLPKQDIFDTYIPLPPKKRKAPKSGQRRRRKRNPVTGELEFDHPPEEAQDDDDADDEPGNEEEEDAGAGAGDDKEIDDNNEDQEEEDEEDEDESNAAPPDRSMQIMGLDTSNPMISYQGRVFSCEWRTTLGTDMFFEKRTPLKDDAVAEASQASKALYPLKEWNLIGLSAAHLHATEANLVFKTHPESSASLNFAPMAERVRMEEENDEENEDDEVQELEIQDQSQTMIERSARSTIPKSNESFISRFNILRASKGEITLGVPTSQAQREQVVPGSSRGIEINLEEDDSGAISETQSQIPAESVKEKSFGRRRGPAKRGPADRLISLPKAGRSWKGNGSNVTRDGQDGNEAENNK